MGAIWSEERRYGTWLEVELAATDALAAAGVVPAEDARILRERASFDIARIEEIEQTTQHDVIAFTTAVAERAGESARWLHFGLTSSDVLDTALAIQMREACDLILKDIDALAAAVRDRANEHRPHADDRTDPRRSRGADDARGQAGALVRGDRAGSRARATRA
jgi:adenylosuccinate lyase